MGNHERCIAIQDEFHRRCHGQSIGYLTEDSLLSFCKLYNRCQNEKPDSLSKKQIALQKAVLDITDENVLNIANVPNEHLLELAAIVLSLKNVSFA
ncbi:unnamed protein product [Didymodactylos carnosus]|nr:unnamed protein product [Didymodactylos carnosus]CAF4463067.1 unnamed protein product [Didymodactylos carnosus]